ncbi:hypothetical protein GCM10025881_02200 [Pseudolysinimonas kribbensis]|uniref:PASTA domain-containing protein n=2 Tax=Pseudolysinimonas kribbensis TaxID=433641 RepID=A0ABQ6K3Q1_9MICO|nr:hypothetical protein GCM10025881_02200 [Pseudolysinimonas kribbensis]
MYEMLTGEQPFTGEQPMQIAYQHANESVPAPSSRNPKVPRPLDELVLWATERDPDRRPRDAREMLEQLKEVAAEIDGTGPTPTLAQRTMVLPTPAVTAPTTVVAPRAMADSETQVIAPHGRMAASPPPARGNAPGPRRSRRWIAVVVVLLLVLAGGGAGWWFLLGPGAHVTIPSSLAGTTPEAATAQLTQLGLVVDTQQGQVNSTTIPAGRVADTKPGLGAAVVKGSTVRLLISQGPKLIDFTIKAGTPVAEARALIKKNWTLAGTPKKQFSDSIAKDTVIDALGADGKTLLGQASYGEGLPVSLIVSAGKLPDVVGQPYDAAARALDAVGVTAEQGQQQNSHTVPQGSVIAIATSGPISPGGTVTLTISKGPEAVTVPDVVGKTWATAKQQLLDAGFQLDYTPKAPSDAFPTVFVVTKTSPAGGSTALWGSTIKVNLKAGG